MIPDIEGVSSVEKYDYEADVYFWGDYDDALGKIGTGFGDSPVATKWTGQPIRAGLDGANRRREAAPDAAFDDGREVLRGHPSGAEDGLTGFPKFSLNRRDAAGRGLDGRGIHYSTEQREVLASSAFGLGTKSEDLERVKNAADERLKHRIYFYVNGGKGINPETGVGSYAHTAFLTNLYDIDADPQDLKIGRVIPEGRQATAAVDQRRPASLP